MSFDPYAPPASYRDARPAAIRWFRVYAASMTLLSLALLGLSARASVTGPAMGTAALLCVVAIALAAVYGVATFVPFKPWGWTWALVAIALGVASGGAVFAVPLLFFWFKPQVKAAFARL